MKIHKAHPLRRRRRRAFTLIELLVAIVIIIGLAVIGMGVSKKMLGKAKAIKALNGIRQSGQIVLANAGENNGSVAISGGGNPTVAYTLYGIVAKHFGFDTEISGSRQEYKTQSYQTLREIVYSPAVDPGEYNVWMTYGSNLDTNPDLGVPTNARKYTTMPNGDKAWVMSLNAGAVLRAGSYPFIADTSDSNGKQRMRFANSNSHKFAMRYSGKGPVVFLDGSCKMLGVSDLKAKREQYRIEEAYLFENGPKTNPTLISIK